MALPADFIERLKTANPIAEVMGSYVTLKRTGSDLVCLCPFHSEKTPSCHVHPGEEYFYCFGCGAGGDVITFTMKYNNLDYMPAVAMLAERAGLSLPEDGFDPKRTDMRKRIYEMNKDAARFFYDQLRSPQGKPCLSYLIQHRKLTPETIKKYGMGFAPNSWNALKNYMMAKGYSEQELETASLISRSMKNGKTFDFFVNRAMFPFFDLAGHIVGFGGRALSDEDKRKYLNSKDTPCYNKNKYLFSLNFAKNAAVKSREIILCEGNLDVISLNQHGFENAVASCGTALTPEQARLLKTYADEVKICYDSDEAGQKATHRAIGILDQIGLKTTVIRVTGAKDPDEYLKKFGSDHFRSLLKGSVGAVEFELQKCREGLDMDTETGRIDYLKRAYMVVAMLSSPVERDIYISKLAEEQDVSKEAIRAEVESIRTRAQRAAQRRETARVLSFTNYPRDEVNPESNTHRNEARAEAGILYYLMFNPGALEESGLTEEDMVTDLNRRFFRILSRLIRSGEYVDFYQFMSQCGAEFSPDEVGKLPRMKEEHDELGVTAEVFREYIAYLRRSRTARNDLSGDDGDINALIERRRRERRG